MTRSTAAAGFSGSAAPVSSIGLLDAVAAALALASLSIWLMATLTLHAAMAMSFPT